MKELLILLSLLILASSGVLANEVEPAQTANDNRAVISIQKQPAKENKQEVKNNWFCIVVQFNGKLKDIDTSATDKRE